MDVERLPSRAIEACAEGGHFGSSFLTQHLAYVFLAEDRKASGEPPGAPPWGDDLDDYAGRLVVSLGGDPERLLWRRQPRGISPDDAGRRIREQVAEELTLLGASRRRLLALLSGAEAKAPTNISNLLCGARQRQDLRRHVLGPKEGEELAQIRDPEERKTRRRYLLALGRGVDSTLAEERAQIRYALERAERDEP